MKKKLTRAEYMKLKNGCQYFPKRKRCRGCEHNYEPELFDGPCKILFDKSYREQFLQEHPEIKKRLSTWPWVDFWPQKNDT